METPSEHDNSNIPSEYQDAVAAWEESVQSLEFTHGVQVGESIGFYDAYREAQRAYEMGEIELWLEYNAPKTTEEWTAWKARYGNNFSKRWHTEES